MVTLKGILTHVLQEHDFDVSERDDVLFGERDDSVVSVGIYDRCESQDINGYLEKIEGVRGSRVIVTADPISPEIEEMATSHNITIWTLDDIEKEIGKAIINHIGMAEDAGTPFFSEILKVQVVEGRGDESEGFPVVIDGLGIDEKEMIRNPKISLEDVKEISQNTVKGFKYDLELVPHYLFEYLCIFTGKGGRERKRTGLIQINAFTGYPAAIEDELKMISRIDIPHVKIEPKIDEDEAQQTVMKKVIELNVEHDDVIIEKEHATVTEKTIFKPKKENITLTKKGLIHVPVWCVEGTNGVMIINAATGKVVSEEYYGQ